VASLKTIFLWEAFVCKVLRSAAAFFLKLTEYIYKRTNVMQLGSMFICNCNIALHVWDAFCVHLQEHLEIVEAASGE